MPKNIMAPGACSRQKPKDSEPIQGSRETSTSCPSSFSMPSRAVAQAFSSLTVTGRSTFAVRLSTSQPSAAAMPLTRAETLSRTSCPVSLERKRTLPANEAVSGMMLRTVPPR